MATKLILTIVTLTLTFVACAQAKVDSEHHCLKQMPGKRCDLKFAYNGKQTTCLQRWTGPVNLTPTLSCSQCAGKDVLILMIDHDLPFQRVKDKGWVHWAAKGNVSTDGSIMVTEQVNGCAYRPPNPRCCDAHRYDTYVFPFDSTKSVNVLDPTGKDRIDTLCDFITRNKLGSPMADMAFKYSNAR